MKNFSFNHLKQFYLRLARQFATFCQNMDCTKGLFQLVPHLSISVETRSGRHAEEVPDVGCGDVCERGKRSVTEISFLTF